MADPPRVSLSQVRIAGRGPRIALLVTCGVLTVSGGVRLFASPQARPMPAVPRVPGDTTEAEGLAERFAAEYLTLAPGRDDAREQRLEDLGLADTGAPPDRSGRAGRRVVATSVASVQRVRTGEVRVTVGANDGRSWTYLAVPVRRSAGRLAVSSPPAVVGPPAVALHSLGKPEDEVPDAALKEVLTRVVRHYVAGDRTDLAADLVPDVQPSLPATPLRVTSVVAVTWAVPGRRAAVVVVVRAPDGVQLTLRYELSVLRRAGRWLVNAVVVNPNRQEQSR